MWMWRDDHARDPVNSAAKMNATPLLNPFPTCPYFTTYGGPIVHAGLIDHHDGLSDDDGFASYSP